MKKDIISIDDMQLEDLQYYLNAAEKIEAMPQSERAHLLPGHVLMVLFYEPSTRTRLSFEAAMCRLGGGVIGFSETSSTSVAKGESFADTILTAEQYADVLVVRHPKEGAARQAADISRCPIINAGDGANQHPTQTLLDLYTIKKFFGSIDGVKIAFAGDLKYSRTVHSLFRALMKFKDVDFTLVSPESLSLPSYLKHPLNNKNDKKLSITETSNLEEAINTCDIVYMTRIQRERFPDDLEYEKVKDSYILDAAMMKTASQKLKILHPLPRVNEISSEIDSLPQAGYFEQVGNGITMRQAILLDVLGVAL